MTTSLPFSLRLVAGDVATAGKPFRAFRWNELCRSFLESTGWPLHFSPHPTASTERPMWAMALQSGNDIRGELRIEAPASFAEIPSADFDSASRLAASIGELAESTFQAEPSAELEPALSETDRQQLQRRIAGVLKTGVNAIAASRAAVYLLDENTSHLQLTAGHGLDGAGMPATRPLAGARADLEALLGHAIVADDPDQFDYWRVPVASPVSVCLPIASDATILGTLWFFCDTPKSIERNQLDVLELVAGRIAIELERAQLREHANRHRNLEQEVTRLQTTMSQRRARVSPILDGWEIAGRTAEPSNGGGFCEWLPLADQNLAVLVGRSHQRGLAGSLDTATLQAAVRAASEHAADARSLLAAVNRVLWTTSAGDLLADVACAVVRASSPSVEFVVAGNAGLARGRDSDWVSSTHSAAALGFDPDSDWPSQTFDVGRGEGIVMAIVESAKERTPRIERSTMPAAATWNAATAGAAARAILGRSKEASPMSPLIAAAVYLTTQDS